MIDEAILLMIYSLLSDLVVAAHLAYACFVLFGLIALLVGIFSGAPWVRNFLFRVSHLVCTAFVAIEAVLGTTCPLTTLENSLLQAAGKAGYQRSFIGNLINKLLFYDAPEWVFTVIYVSLTILALLALFLAPPSQLRKQAS